MIGQPVHWDIVPVSISEGNGIDIGSFAFVILVELSPVLNELYRKTHIATVTASSCTCSYDLLFALTREVIRASLIIVPVENVAKVWVATEMSASIIWRVVLNNILVLTASCSLLATYLCHAKDHGVLLITFPQE